MYVRKLFSRKILQVRMLLFLKILLILQHTEKKQLQLFECFVFRTCNN